MLRLNYKGLVTVLGCASALALAGAASLPRPSVVQGIGGMEVGCQSIYSSPCSGFVSDCSGTVVKCSPGNTNFICTGGQGGCTSSIDSNCAKIATAYACSVP